MLSTETFRLDKDDNLSDYSFLFEYSGSYGDLLFGENVLFEEELPTTGDNYYDDAAYCCCCCC